MGSTPKTVTHFEDWLRRQLLEKRWRIADLAREIARQEGIAESDDEDFRRRAKSIQNNFSNVFNGLSNLGFEYATKIADALGLKPEEVMKEAGLIRPSTQPAQSDARRKINQLIEMLSPEEQEQAIKVLEEFTRRRKAEIKAASQRRLKRS